MTAFLHGCTQQEAIRISDWLDRAKTALKHPLLPAVVIAEIQLERHGRIYRQYYERYIALFDDISSKSEEVQSKKNILHEADDLGVAKWLPQIFRMYQKHRNFQRLLASFRRILDSLLEMSNHYQESSEDFNLTGRLHEISHHYENLIDQSNIIADGVSLLLTTVSLITQEQGQSISRLLDIALTE